MKGWWFIVWICVVLVWLGLWWGVSAPHAGTGPDYPWCCLPVQPAPEPTRAAMLRQIPENLPELYWERQPTSSAAAEGHNATLRSLPPETRGPPGADRPRWVPPGAASKNAGGSKIPIPRSGQAEIRRGEVSSQKMGFCNRL